MLETLMQIKLFMIIGNIWNHLNEWKEMTDA